MWHPQLDDLADAFRVLALDLPGHGALADVPFRLADASDAVGEVIDAAGGRAIVVGLSLGAYVGMHLAAGHPDRVAGLVLANASAEPRSIARRAPRTVGTYLLTAAAERLRGRAGTPGGEVAPTRVPARRARALPRRPTRRTLRPRTAGSSRAGRGRWWRPWVRRSSPGSPRTRGPTLLVNGEDDLLFRTR